MKNQLAMLLDNAEWLKKIISERKRRFLEKRPPSIVQVETTTACNAECIMCPHNKISRAKGHLEFEIYKKVVDECSQYSPYLKTFFPFLNGELFLTPDWDKYLSYGIGKLPFAEVGIFTNGSLLHTGNIDKLINIKPDWINISFDGTSKETYETIRRKLKFDIVESNILQLIAKRDASGLSKPRVTISIVEMEQTKPGLSKFFSKWSSVVDKVTVEPYSNWIDIKEGITHDVKRGHRKPCSRLWYNFTVLNSGDVVICCLDYNGEIVIGNIKKQSVKEIWAGEKMAELRKLHLRRQFSQIPLCKNCNFGVYQPGAPAWWY